MREFVITTDATADMPSEFFVENKIDVLPMPYSINNVEYGSYESKMSIEDFYKKLRAGAMPVTSQIRQFDAMECFEKHVKEGKDILHISLSSGISGTFDNTNLAKREVLEKYPDANIYVVDSLCGAGGEGMMVYYVNKMKGEGKSIKEIYDWCVDTRLNFQHLFIVEDLAFLRRGGRLSLIEATLGTILGIKPVLELNEKGKINAVEKCIGKKKAIKAMIASMRKNIKFGANDFIGIGHGDCIDEAKKVASLIEEEFGIKNFVFTYVNTLVGSHAGAGALALFYIGNKRYNS